LALKPHPISITLAQAAMESSWGTSRFFKEANNLFGIWSFNKKEPRIAASGQRGTKTIWLKKYSSVEDSVTDYYKNLGRSFAFKEFREEKMLSNNPYILVTKLDRYSEKGSKYGEELTSMMSYNKFLKYDDTFFERPKKIEAIEVEEIKIETSKREEQPTEVAQIEVEKIQVAQTDIKQTNETTTEVLKKKELILNPPLNDITLQKEITSIANEPLPNTVKEELTQNVKEES